MYHGRKEFFSCLHIFLILFPFCASIDTITPNQPLKDGDVLISTGESFALGFFSPNNSSTKRYVCIWFNKVSVQTIVWTANRDNPISDTSGILSIDITGNLVLHDKNGGVPIWSTNVSSTTTTNTSSAQLLDSGNLMLFRDFSKRAEAWQSSDYPTDTWLPFMKLGLDKRTGLNRFLTSWKSREDPGTGEYTYKMDPNGAPQIFLRKGLTPLWRTGPWNGLAWSGMPQMVSHRVFNATYVDNQDDVSMMYGVINHSIFSRFTVNESGTVERSSWSVGLRKWVTFMYEPNEPCENYGHCGAFGACDPYEEAVGFECKCLPGFEPKSPRDWYLRDGSNGCVRKREGQVCRNGEGFVTQVGVKVPDTSIKTRVNKSLDLKACEELCLRDCSCTGFTSADIRGGGGGSGCITWHGDMIDTRQFSNGGQNVYIRVDAVELAQHSKKSRRFRGYRMVATVVVSAVAAIFLILCLAYLLVKKRRGMRRQHEMLFSTNATSTSFERSSRGKEIYESETNADLLFFDLSAIVAATDNFSLANKLGEGGFGSVYKGRLRNGQEVAVKRLSTSSGQGIEQFKNEVRLIAKLQHRNLVRLLGYCTQNEEKMLIYEYMPNKGLDSLIFDKEKGSVLVVWRKCFEIILGIARGMLYLHQDSRLRIIHRDLKASNVLLDASMNPKISDFGMARIFGANQIEATTNRVVGTYGYMSPEYAMEGLFSVKSDVFSFGVLLFEIISGRKNTSYYKDNFMTLIEHVWELWKDGKALDIVDSSFGESYEAHKVLRCIHIGLLCVQEFASDRPTMAEVVVMLCNETTLPSPNQPSFIFRKQNNGPNLLLATSGPISVDDATITMLEPR